MLTLCGCECGASWGLCNGSHKALGARCCPSGSPKARVGVEVRIGPGDSSKRHTSGGVANCSGVIDFRHKGFPETCQGAVYSVHIEKPPYLQSAMFWLNDSCVEMNRRSASSASVQWLQTGHFCSHSPEASSTSGHTQSWSVIQSNHAAKPVLSGTHATWLHLHRYTVSASALSVV